MVPVSFSTATLVEAVIASSVHFPSAVAAFPLVAFFRS